MKQRISITVDRELLAWIDQRVEEGVFSNRSHGLSYVVLQGMREDSHES